MYRPCETTEKQQATSSSCSGVTPDTRVLFVLRTREGRSLTCFCAVPCGNADAHKISSSVNSQRVSGSSRTQEQHEKQSLRLACSHILHVRVTRVWEASCVCKGCRAEEGPSVLTLQSPTSCSPRRPLQISSVHMLNSRLQLVRMVPRPSLWQSISARTNTIQLLSQRFMQAKLHENR